MKDSPETPANVPAAITRLLIDLLVKYALQENSNISKSHLLTGSCWRNWARKIASVSVRALHGRKQTRKQHKTPSPLCSTYPAHSHFVVNLLYTFKFKYTHTHLQTHTCSQTHTLHKAGALLDIISFAFGRSAQSNSMDFCLGSL